MPIPPVASYISGPLQLHLLYLILVSDHFENLKELRTQCPAAHINLT